MDEQPRRIASDDERLTERWERKNNSREYDDGYPPEDENEDDGIVFCDECGKQCKWSGEEGGYVCFWHGLQ